MDEICIVPNSNPWTDSDEPTWERRSNRNSYVITKFTCNCPTLLEWLQTQLSTCKIWLYRSFVAAAENDQKGFIIVRRCLEAEANMTCSRRI